MATREDLNQDLSVGMTEVRRTLEHYNLGEWQEYLIVRRKGRPDSFIVLAKEKDKSGFAERLTAFHKEQAKLESAKCSNPYCLDGWVDHEEGTQGGRESYVSQVPCELCQVHSS